jgi:Flp pilus assembly protein TadD
MTYYNHGYTLFLQTGNLEARDNLYRQALSKFRQASALAPHDPQPIFNEAVVLVEMDQRDKSYNLLKRVISMAAPDAKPLKREAQRIMARIEARGKAR